MSRDIERQPSRPFDPRPSAYQAGRDLAQLLRSMRRTERRVKREVRVKRDELIVSEEQIETEWYYE